MAVARTQRWHLIGLGPMHDAMIRRLAIQERTTANRIEGTDANIEWSTSRELTSWSAWTRPDNTDIIVIHRDQLLAAIDRFGAIDRCQCLVPDSAWRLRLLWSWLPLGKHDASWSAPWFASGVISEPRTLHSWVRVASRKGSLSPRSPHSLLRDIQLPSL